MFDKDLGFRARNLFDTRIAAELAGSARSGLQAVVKEYADESISNPLNLQRSDWTERPLNLEALVYAINDVLHLLQVREALIARLENLSCLSWAVEEFERMQNVRFSPPDPELAFLSVKGSRDLGRRGLQSYGLYADPANAKQTSRPSAVQSHARFRFIHSGIRS